MNAKELNEILVVAEDALTSLGENQLKKLLNEIGCGDKALDLLV